MGQELNCLSNWQLIESNSNWVFGINKFLMDNSWGTPINFQSQIPLNNNEKIKKLLSQEKYKFWGLSRNFKINFSFF